MDKKEEQVALSVGRPELINFLVSKILSVTVTSCTTVIGIDGIDLSGKTMLAEELKGALERLRKKVVVIHEDDLLNPKSIRYQQGKWSPVGFYEDFFDFRSLARDILIPLREENSIDIEMERVNSITDVYDSLIHHVITHSCYVIVEGLFLLRAELANLFDLTIRLKIPAWLVMDRAMIRDVPRLGDEEYVRKHYLSQSIPAQEIYEKSHRPDLRADIVVDNSDTSNPVIIKV